MELKENLTDNLIIKLSYIPPYDYPTILKFIKARILLNIEYIENEIYHRSVYLENYTGWIKVYNDSNETALIAEISINLAPLLTKIIKKIRNIFDLDIDPIEVNKFFSKNLLFKDSLLNNPGLRMAGSFDPYELSIRAILGQQISYKAANLLTGKFIRKFGKELDIAYNQINYAFPEIKLVANLSVVDLNNIGIIKARAQTIISLSENIMLGNISFSEEFSTTEIIEQLMSIKGIGSWTANYIAMHSLGYKDAFLENDIAIKKALGNITAKQALAISKDWIPYRSYATLHLWYSFII